MIGNNSETDLRDVRFVICYDKSTESAAHSLYNQLSGRYKCVLWTKDVYMANMPKFTNHNKRIILHPDLAAISLGNHHLEAREVVPGIDCKMEGQTIGLFYNPDSAPSKAKRLGLEMKKDMVKNTISELLLPGSSLHELYRVNKLSKKELYQDAVDRLAGGLLEEILNG